MPNGGSDNCGTCWFNARNKGEARFRVDLPGPDFCTIRGLPIEVALWTYCNNHPKHRPAPDPVPIGPVFVIDDDVRAYRRKVWQPSPDTEEIRLHLLALLSAIQETPEDEYGTVYTDELVVWQLGEFAEPRAVPDLQRIAAFSPDARSPRRGRTRKAIISYAEQALAKMRERGERASGT